MRWDGAAQLCGAARAELGALAPHRHHSLVCESCGRKLLDVLLRELMERVLSVKGVDLDLLTKRRVLQEVKQFAREKGIRDD